MSRFYQGLPWRWVVLAVTDWSAPQLRIVTFLDHLTVNATYERILCDPNVIKLTVPADNPEVFIGDPVDDQPYVAEGIRCIVGLRPENIGSAPLWEPRASGILYQPSDSASSGDGAGVGYTDITAIDPWQLLYKRPVCSFTGKLPDPDAPIKFIDVPADTVALTLLFNTEAAHGPTLIDSSHLPGDELAPISITFDRGLTVGEAWKQLCDANYMDIILDPILDLGGGFISRLRIAAKAGEARYDSVFAYAAPGSSLAGVTRGEDGTMRADKVVEFNGSGGAQVPFGAGASLTNHTAVAEFGESWLIKAQDKTTIGANALALAQADLDQRAFGVTTISVTPIPERSAVPLSGYDIGDSVPVLASPTALRKRIEGVWRVTRIPITMPASAPESVDSLEVTSDEIPGT